MRLVTSKSQPRRFLETAKTINDSVPGSTKRKIVAAAIVTGGLAGLTAGSAAVSSLRRRMEGASDD
jgi:hypothetical protein